MVSPLDFSLSNNNGNVLKNTLNRHGIILLKYASVTKICHLRLIVRLCCMANDNFGLSSVQMNTKGQRGNNSSLHQVTFKRKKTERH